MDNISEERLKLVNPILADKVRELARRLEVEGVVIRVTQGLRTWREQDDLYALGRTKVSHVACKCRLPIGTCPKHPKGAKVTNARGGYGWHNFGLAVDVVPDLDITDDRFTPDWDESHPAWARIIAIATSLGLTSGTAFNDDPHLQMHGRFPLGAPDDECRQLFRDGGMSAVWEEARLLG